MRRDENSWKTSVLSTLICQTPKKAVKWFIGIISVGSLLEIVCVGNST